MAEEKKAAKTKSKEKEATASAEPASVEGSTVAPGEVAAATVAEPAAKPEKKPAKGKKAEPVAAPPTPPENLSLGPDEIEKPKIIKAKGAKNIHSGIAHVLA